MPSSRLLVGVSMCALVSAAAAAPPAGTTTAATPDATETAPPPRARRWYGWQVIAADAPGWYAAWRFQPATMTLLGTGPIVHLLNGEDERAQASLAARLTGAVVGASVVGLVLFDRDCKPGTETCPPDGPVILKGAAVGLIAAELVDVIIFAWTSTADGADALPGLGERRRAGRSIPRGDVAIGDGSVYLSVSGTF